MREFSLSTTITLRLASFSFLPTVLYGPSDDAHKHRFVRELQLIKPPDPCPWLCLGDFNLIYQAQDKNNLNLNRRFMGMFRRRLDNLNLNRKYTWSNERHNATLKLLDRVFCNKEWDLGFLSVCLQALSSSASDNCPVFLSQIHQQHRCARFKFEHLWISPSFPRYGGSGLGSAGLKSLGAERAAPQAYQHHPNLKSLEHLHLQ